MELGQIDLDALRRASAMACEDPECSKHFQSLLLERDWSDVAMSAVYRYQTKTLLLKLWESPPMYGLAVDRDGRPLDPQAAKLADQLLDAGLSVFEPDPVTSLTRVKKRKQAGGRAGASK